MLKKLLGLCITIVVGLALLFVFRKVEYDLNFWNDTGNLELLGMHILQLILLYFFVILPWASIGAMVYTLYKEKTSKIFVKRVFTGSKGLAALAIIVTSIFLVTLIYMALCTLAPNVFGNDDITQIFKYSGPGKLTTIAKILAVNITIGIIASFAFYIPAYYNLKTDYSTYEEKMSVASNFNLGQLIVFLLSPLIVWRILCCEYLDPILNKEYSWERYSMKNQYFTKDDLVYAKQKAEDTHYQLAQVVQYSLSGKDVNIRFFHNGVQSSSPCDDTYHLKCAEDILTAYTYPEADAEKPIKCNVVGFNSDTLTFDCVTPGFHRIEVPIALLFYVQKNKRINRKLELADDVKETYQKQKVFEEEVLAGEKREKIDPSVLFRKRYLSQLMMLIIRIACIAVGNMLMRNRLENLLWFVVTAIIGLIISGLPAYASLVRYGIAGAFGNLLNFRTYTYYTVNEYGTKSRDDMRTLSAAQNRVMLQGIMWFFALYAALVINVVSIPLEMIMLAWMSLKHVRNGYKTGLIYAVIPIMIVGVSFVYLYYGSFTVMFESIQSDLDRKRQFNDMIDGIKSRKK